MDQQNNQAQADKVVAGLQRDFKIVGSHHVHPWYAWAIVGIVFGMALAIVYVSNRNTEFASTQAATSVTATTTKDFYVQSNSFSMRDLPLTGGSITVAPIGTMPGTAADYDSLQVKQPSAAYKKAALDKEFRKAALQARGVEFISVMRLADKKPVKAETIPAGGGFSFKVPIGIPADLASNITRAQLAFTSTENVTVLINDVAQGGVYERTKGAAAEVRKMWIPQGALRAGSNVVEFRLIRPEVAQREFVLSFILGFTATADSSAQLTFKGADIVSKVQPRALIDWAKREEAAGRLPAVGKYHADRSGPRIMERYYITAPAAPLVIQGFVFEKKNAPVKKAVLGVGYANQTAYGNSFPDLTIAQLLETDPRLAAMTIDNVSVAIVDPATGLRTMLSGSYTVTNTEEKTLTFTLPAPVTVQPVTTLVLEFYGDPRTPLADSDLRDGAVRYALVLQEPFRFTEIALAGSESLKVENNVNVRAADAKPGIPASLSVARNNFFDQVVTYESKPLSTPYYTRTAGDGAAVPVFELSQTYGLSNLGIVPEVFVFGYDVQTEEGAPRLTDFVYRGIRGVEVEPGKLVFDMKSGTPTISAYDPHYNRVIAKAAVGSKPGAKATYRFRMLPDEAVFRVRTEVLGPDARPENVKYVIRNAAGARTVEGIRPIVVSNP
jgi:hypothetical protein